MKRAWKRTKKAGADPQLALLALRNTPMEGRIASPAELLFSRRCKTILPTADHLLKPCVVEGAEKRLQDVRLEQEEQYNTHARDLPPLDVRNTVRVQPLHGQREW